MNPLPQQRYLQYLFEYNNLKALKIHPQRASATRNQLKERTMHFEPEIVFQKCYTYERLTRTN